MVSGRERFHVAFSRCWSRPRRTPGAPNLPAPVGAGRPASRKGPGPGVTASESAEPRSPASSPPRHCCRAVAGRWGVISAADVAAAAKKRGVPRKAGPQVGDELISWQFSAARPVSGGWLLAPDSCGPSAGQGAGPAERCQDG